MREPGGGTLFSPVIEKAKVSVKVPANESSENRKQLSSLGAIGGYASFVGAKSMLAGSILPPAAPFPAGGRLKGGNSNPISAHTHCHDNSALLDLSAAERLKELRARLEPTSAATPPLQESGALPHWGLGKRLQRLRRRRFEVSKHGVGDDMAGRARGEGQFEDCGVKQRGHGWAARVANVGPADVADFAKGTPRNGLSSRGAANGVHSTSTLTRQGNGRERERGAGLVQSYTGEAGCGGRQRSDGGAERPIKSNDGQVGAHNSAPLFSVSGMVGAAALASVVKPRLDLPKLEWPRILIAISRKEKEEDFFILKGAKLPQRPKKRPKAVERALHVS